MFAPTHTFQGVELEFSYDYSEDLGYYRVESGDHLYIPKKLVTPIQPKPKPGEVWKYVGAFADDTPDRNLVLISDEYGPKFVNEEGDTIPFEGDDLTKPNFIKVLNADGTPA